MKPAIPAAPPVRPPIAVKFGNTPAPSTLVSIVETAPSSLHVSKSRSVNDLVIEHRKFGPYVKCDACSANNAFMIGGGVAGPKEKIRKDKLRFYRECEGCGSSSAWFTNNGEGVRLSADAPSTIQQMAGQLNDEHGDCEP